MLIKAPANIISVKDIDRGKIMSKFYTKSTLTVTSDCIAQSIPGGYQLVTSMCY
jgi:hypothetical protein